MVTKYFDVGGDIVELVYCFLECIKSWKFKFIFD